ncbi:tetratricopeptide repeat protein [Maribacter thermophilus]|uniref:tetratricopeptide repeat protein n=1 Tax=Maribacter thermophilus TaxID=1197874 RepID=UPI000640BA59|nr:tetratricopeptide repeat protein [Maribacter thermophilus]
MKTKLYFTAIMFLGMMGVSNAQAQNPECMTNLSIFSEHAKVKNYDAAYEPWKKTYETCPQLNNAIYVYGERILKDKIEKAGAGEKESYANELMGLYDNKLKYFSSKTSLGETIVDKALVKYDNKMADDAEMYEMLSEAFAKDKENFTNPKALYIYFSSLVDLHNAGKKDLQEVFDVYDDVTGKIEEENDKLTDKIAKLLPKEEAGTLTSKEKRSLKVYNSYSVNYGKISSSIDSKLGALADCSNLIPLYEKNFEEKKNDVNWVKRAVGRMFSKECTDDPMFKKLFEAQLALDPSADAYVYGGTLKKKAGDTKGAVEDFNKALELETDPKKKSNIAYKIATSYAKTSKSSARSFAQKAIDANPANGKAYLLIASLYASSANACGSTPFEKRAIYWKAENLARQAGRVDPALSSRASQAAASYSAKAPTKEMIFSSGMAGKTVSFSCWVGGSVKVPSL